MSTLSLRKIKHDSSFVDNITLDSNGNLTVAGTIAQSKAMTTQYDGIGIRMGSSTANTNRGATFLQHTYVDSGGNQGNYVYNHSLRQNDGTYIANVYTADYSAGVHSWYHPNGGLSGNPVMQIDTVGRVTLPYQPFFYVKNGDEAGDGITTNPFRFSSVVKNVGNHFVTSGTGAYSRFVAPVAGVYAFTANPGYKQSSLDFVCRVRVNGAYLTDLIRLIGYPSSHSGGCYAFNIYLNANDYVDLTPDGSTYHRNNSNVPNWFSGMLIG